MVPGSATNAGVSEILVGEPAVFVGATGDEHPDAMAIAIATYDAAAHLLFTFFIAVTGVAHADAQDAAVPGATVISAR